MCHRDEQQDADHDGDHGDRGGQEGKVDLLLASPGPKGANRERAIVYILVSCYCSLCACRVEKFKSAVCAV